MLKWDGKARLDGMLTRYCGAEANPYTECVSAKMMIAMVRRVRRPGTKFDQMAILEGRQGVGKSRFLRTLAKRAAWFTDDMALNLDSKEIIEKTSGKALVEIPELQKYRKAEIEQVKAMLSRQEDRARAAYGRFVANQPRGFVFWGSVNVEEMDDGPRCDYLKDPTGNRRFWPIRCNGRIKVEELQKDIDQVWAEAAHREAQGESIEMPEGLWEAAKQQQDERMEKDPLAEILADKFEGLEGKVLVEDVLTIVGKRPGDMTNQVYKRFGKAMRDLGFERKQIRHEGKPRWHYVKADPNATISVSVLGMGEVKVEKARNCQTAM